MAVFKDDDGLPFERGATRRILRNPGANPRDVFKQMRNTPGFGRGLGNRMPTRLPLRLPLRLPPQLEVPLMLAPVLIPYFWPGAEPRPWGNGWQQVNVCAGAHPSTHVARWSNNPVVNPLCLGGQAISPVATIAAAIILPSHRRFCFVRQTSTTPRYFEGEFWNRPAGNYTENTPLLRWRNGLAPAGVFGHSPNDLRHAPSPPPDYQLGVGAPPALPEVPAQAFEFTDGPPAKAPPTTRNPPAPGTRESKTRSRANRLMVGIFKVLDELSEASEIVDAFYSTLPEKTRKRWEEKYSDERGFIDNAGQYGIGGADWKIMAIYHNWHVFSDLPTLELALKRAVWNTLEDKVYGGIHQRLPRNTGAALDQGMRGLAEYLGEVQEWLGI